MPTIKQGQFSVIDQKSYLQRRASSQDSRGGSLVSKSYTQETKSSQNKKQVNLKQRHHQRQHSRPTVARSYNSDDCKRIPPEQQHYFSQQGQPLPFDSTQFQSGVSQSHHINIEQIEMEAQIFDRYITKDKGQEKNKETYELEQENRQLKETLYQERLNYEKQLRKMDGHVQVLKQKQADVEALHQKIRNYESKQEENNRAQEQLLVSLQQKDTTIQQQSHHIERLVQEQQRQSHLHQEQTKQQQQLIDKLQKQIENTIPQQAQPLQEQQYYSFGNEQEVPKKEEQEQEQKQPFSTLDMMEVIEEREEIQENSQQKVPKGEHKQTSREKYALVIHDFVAQRENDIGLKRGQRVKVLQTKDNGWWIGICDGKIGFFPFNYVQLQ